MSSIVSVATGVLLFDGPARITPVVKLLFDPFHLNADDSESRDQQYIDLLGDSSVPDWDVYLSQLINTLSKTSPVETADRDNPIQVLQAIGTHFGVDLQAFAESTVLIDQVCIEDVVRLARLIQDGHNLIGVSMEGAWHSGKAQLWNYGGWSLHQTPYCKVNLSSFDVRTFANALDDALHLSIPSTTRVVKDWLGRILDSIANTRWRDVLRHRYGLPNPSTASSDDDEYWRRFIYVGAHATDEQDGPEWARIDITPAFVRKIRAMRAVCCLEELSEVSVVDRPARWGQNISWHKLPLTSPRLIVTADTFWFSEQPHRRVCAFETLPLSVDWLVSSVTGNGAHFCHRVDPLSVHD